VVAERWIEKRRYRTRSRVFAGERMDIDMGVRVGFLHRVVVGDAAWKVVPHDLIIVLD